MDGFHNEKLLYGSSLKNLFFFFFGGRGGWGWCMKKQFFLGGGVVNCLKREAWIVCRFKRGFGKKGKKKGLHF